MIKPGEIQKIARIAGVRDQQIEKDYVLSWILQGLSRHEEFSKAIIFKGGTVLKKVYFEDYRFSEDLDFTLIKEEVSNRQILDYFKDLFDYVKEKANIPLEIIDDNEHQDGGLNIYVGYVGPLGGIGSNKKVKVDISKNETLQFDPSIKDVITKYSDQEEHKLLCYSLEEILVEKLRSVIQRVQARDFYDIWYLLAVQGLEIEFYRNEFISKCQSKNINPFDFFIKLEQRLPQYKARWKKSMKDQIKNLPEFEQIERELMRHFKKLENPR
jgi:uncharacterized protein